MITSIQNLLAVSLGLATLVHAQFDPKLVGTWTTKSKKVITGPVSVLPELRATRYSSSTISTVFQLTMRFFTFRGFTIP